MGIVITMLSLLILIPLASVLVYALKLSPAEFFSLVTKPNVLHAFRTSILCSLAAALVNCVFGVIVAWVLVRYDFPGKRLLDGCIELPFALPTAVAGITLSKLYSETGFLGKPLAKLGQASAVDSDEVFKVVDVHIVVAVEPRKQDCAAEVDDFLNRGLSRKGLAAPAEMAHRA